MNTCLEKVNDLKLFQRTADGDHAAFTELYFRHSAVVFSVALKILADHEEARDVSQQVFLKLLHKAPLFLQQKGKPAAWLVALTRNQSLDRLRHFKCRRLLEEKLYHNAATLGGSGYQILGYTYFSDEVLQLHGALAELRTDEIHVIHLAYFCGLSHAKIAAQLSQPLGSIKARIRRALSKLRTSLEKTAEQQADAA